MSDAAGQLSSLLGDQESLLNLFSALQKLMLESSLNPVVRKYGERYDHMIDQDSLPLRDLNDQKLAEVASKLIAQIDAQLDLRLIAERFPIVYGDPLNNVIHKELSLYKGLLTEIRRAIEALVRWLHGEL